MVWAGSWMFCPGAGLFIWEAEQVTVEALVATVDHSDIRGSEPHSHDPSGAASD